MRLKKELFRLAIVNVGHFLERSREVVDMFKRRS